MRSRSPINLAQIGWFLMEGMLVVAAAGLLVYFTHFVLFPWMKAKAKGPSKSATLFSCPIIKETSVFPWVAAHRNALAVWDGNPKFAAFLPSPKKGHQDLASLRQLLNLSVPDSQFGLFAFNHSKDWEVAAANKSPDGSAIVFGGLLAWYHDEAPSQSVGQYLIKNDGQRVQMPDSQTVAVKDWAYFLPCAPDGKPKVLSFFFTAWNKNSSKVRPATELALFVDGVKVRHHISWVKCHRHLGRGVAMVSGEPICLEGGFEMGAQWPQTKIHYMDVEDDDNQRHSTIAVNGMPLLALHPVPNNF